MKMFKKIMTLLLTFILILPNMYLHIVLANDGSAVAVTVTEESTSVSGVYRLAFRVRTPQVPVNGVTIVFSYDHSVLTPVDSDNFNAIASIDDFDFDRFEPFNFVFQPLVTSNDVMISTSFEVTSTHTIVTVIIMDFDFDAPESTGGFDSVFTFYYEATSLFDSRTFLLGDDRDASTFGVVITTDMWDNWVTYVWGSDDLAFGEVPIPDSNVNIHFSNARYAVVGNQLSSVIEGQSTAVSFPVSSNGIRSGFLPITITGLPSGISTSANLFVAADGTSTITLTYNGVASAGVYPLVLTFTTVYLFDEQVSYEFELIISEANFLVTRVATSTVPAGNMEITPAGAQAANTPMTVTVTPPTGQQIVAGSLSVTGVAGIVPTANGANFPMPVGGGEIVVNAQFEAIPPVTYLVTVASEVIANVSVNTLSATVGDIITVTINPPAGQRLPDNGVIATGVITFTGNIAGSTMVTFVKTAGSTEVSATFENIPLTARAWSASVNGIGTLNTTTGNAYSGNSVTLAFNARPGFNLTAVTITGEGINQLAVTRNFSARTITFVMPTGMSVLAVTVTPTWTAIITDPGDDDTWTPPVATPIPTPTPVPDTPPVETPTKIPTTILAIGGTANTDGGTVEIDITFDEETGAVNVYLTANVKDKLMLYALRQAYEEEAQPVIVFDLSAIEQATFVSAFNVDMARAFSEAGISVTLQFPRAEITLDSYKLAEIANITEYGDAPITIGLTKISTLEQFSGENTEHEDATASATGERITDEDNISTSIFLSVDISIAVGDEFIEGASVDFLVSVSLDEFDFDGINTYRIAAMFSSPTIKGGIFDTETAMFIFRTSATGFFTIAYVETLSRLTIQLESFIIYDLAGNAPTQEMDVLPLSVDNRTLVPIRFVAYALGAYVDWSRATNYSPTLAHITLNGRTLTFPIDGTITPELAALGMDVPPMIVDNRTMVPLRFITEVFRALVEWDGVAERIEIIRDLTSPGSNSSTNDATLPLSSTIVAIIDRSAIEAIERALLDIDNTNE